MQRMYPRHLLGLAVPVDARCVIYNGLASRRIGSSIPALYQHRYEDVTRVNRRTHNPPCKRTGLIRSGRRRAGITLLEI
jgi:hypothetical protein